MDSVSIHISSDTFETMNMKNDFGFNSSTACETQFGIALCMATIESRHSQMGKNDV